jgi:hypothetical protein
MAWTDVLSHLLGRRELAQRGALETRAQNLGLQQAIGGQKLAQTKAWTDMLGGAGDTFLGIAQHRQGQQFEAKEAEKGRQFEAREREARQDFEKETRDFNEQAIQKDYTYEYTYTHPWSGKTITLTGDGSPATHQLNNTRLSEFINMWNAYMQKDLTGSGLPEIKGNLLDEADKIRQAIISRAGGFFDDNGFPAFQEGETYEDWEARLFSEYGGLIDTFIRSTMEQFPNITEEDLRNAIFFDIRQQEAMTPEIPEEEKERTRVGAGLGDIGDLLGQFGSGMREQREKELPIIEDEFKEITGKGVPFDLARQFTVTRPTQTQDIVGIWENDIMRMLALLQGKTNTQETQEMQRVYDLIAGAGKYGTRPQREALLNSIKEIFNRYQ